MPAAPSGALRINLRSQRETEEPNAEARVYEVGRFLLICKRSGSCRGRSLGGAPAGRASLGLRKFNMNMDLAGRDKGLEVQGHLQLQCVFEATLGFS